MLESAKIHILVTKRKKDKKWMTQWKREEKPRKRTEIQSTRQTSEREVQ